MMCSSEEKCVVPRELPGEQHEVLEDTEDECDEDPEHTARGRRRTEDLVGGGGMLGLS